MNVKVCITFLNFRCKIWHNFYKKFVKWVRNSFHLSNFYFVNYQFFGKGVTCTSLFSNNLFYYFPCLFYVTFKKLWFALIMTCFRFFLICSNKYLYFLYIVSFSFSIVFFVFFNFSYSLCFCLDDFCRPLVIQGDCKCWVLIYISLFGKAVSCKSEKIKRKVSYDLFG